MDNAVNAQGDFVEQQNAAETPAFVRSSGDFLARPRPMASNFIATRCDLLFPAPIGVKEGARALFERASNPVKKINITARSRRVAL